MNSEDISTVRFGVFVQGRGLRHWERESVELLQASGATCLFILAPPEAAPGRSSVARVLDRLVLRIAGFPAESRAAHESDFPRHQPSMTCAVDRTAAGEPGLSSEQRLQLSDRSLKFILFFGAGEVPKGLAGCAELGVWRFTRSSGGTMDYPFVHGLCRREDVVSFGLEQVAEHEGHRRLLLNGHFRARGERNRAVVAQVLSEANRWPLHVLKYVLLNDELPISADGGSTDGARHHSLTLFFSLLYRDPLLHLVSKIASYFVLETWNIGFARMNFPALLAATTLSDVALLPRRELGHYLADPFILSATPELTFLAEDYDDFRVGRIVEVTVRNPFAKPAVDVKVCLESTHHLSYPFVFREEGITYCLPECHQSNAALLYRYDAGTLTPVTDLVPGAKVIDGTILFHGGLYWLFCGLQNDNDHINLHLFFSNALHGNWSAHPLNPVKTDVRSSRSAGPIIAHQGALFRPAQDCSRSYGYGLSVNRIDCLTVTRFEETAVATIRPEAISGSCKGVHTLSFAGDLMVIDVKFHVVGFEPILIRALRRVKRMTGPLFSRIPFLSQSA